MRGLTSSRASACWDEQHSGVRATRSTAICRKGPGKNGGGERRSDLRQIRSRTTERDRKRSSATLRISRPRSGRRWREAEWKNRQLFLLGPEAPPLRTRASVADRWRISGETAPLEHGAIPGTRPGRGLVGCIRSIARRARGTVPCFSSARSALFPLFRSFCSAPESSRGPDAVCPAFDCGRRRRLFVARAQRLLVERLPTAPRFGRRGSFSPRSCGGGKEWHPRSAIAESWGTRVSVRDHACASRYEVRAGSTRRGRSGAPRPGKVVARPTGR